MFVYGILFVIIFVEIGFVVMLFLLGDFLLFVIGVFGVLGVVNFSLTCVLFFVAATFGDMVNYFIGFYVGVNFMEMYLKIFFFEYIVKI